MRRRDLLKALGSGLILPGVSRAAPPLIPLISGALPPYILDRSKFQSTPAFKDDFSGGLSLWNGSTGTWCTAYPDPSNPTQQIYIPDHRTVAGSQEQETYGDAAYTGGLVNPFSTGSNGLTITASNIGSIMPIPIGSLTNTYATNGKALATGVDTSHMVANVRYVINSTDQTDDALYTGERGNITILTVDPVNGSFQYNLGSNPGHDALGSCTYSFMNNNTSVVSGLITTEHSFSQGFGLFEWRGVTLPGGRGVWPALWLLPYATSGKPEIDVLENYGGIYGNGFHQPYEAFHTLHYISSGGAAGQQVQTSFLPSNAFTGTNNFAVDIDRRYIAMYLNDVLTSAYSNIDPLTGLSIVSEQTPLFMLVNLAVSTLSGGAWTTADFPQAMTIGQAVAYAPQSGY